MQRTTTKQEKTPFTFHSNQNKNNNNPHLQYSSPRIQSWDIEKIASSSRCRIISILGALGAPPPRPPPPPQFWRQPSDISQPVMHYDENYDTKRLNHVPAVTNISGTDTTTAMVAYDDETVVTALHHETTTTESNGRSVLVPQQDSLHHSLLVEQCLSRYQAFLQMIDWSLEDLQLATRMQLGLGWKQQAAATTTTNNKPRRTIGTGSVDRVERAFVGRILRRQEQTNKPEKKTHTSPPDHPGSSNPNSDSRKTASHGCNNRRVGLAMSLLRKRVFQLLIQHCRIVQSLRTELLTTATTVENNDSDNHDHPHEMDHPASTIRNTESDEDQDEETLPVITLTLLRSKKEELVYGLSQLAEHVLWRNELDSQWQCNSNENENKNRRVETCAAALEKATRNVTESQIYLQSCLGLDCQHVDTTAILRNESIMNMIFDSTTTNDTGNQFSFVMKRILDQLNGLQIAARSLLEEEEVIQEEEEEEEVNQDDGALRNNRPNHDNKRLEWWNRLQTMVVELESMMEQVNERYFRSRKNRNGKNSTEEEEEEEDRRGRLTHLQEESGEYTRMTDETQPNASSNHRPTINLRRRRENERNKTVVFLLGEKGHHDDNGGGGGRTIGGTGSSSTQTFRPNTEEQLLLVELENRLGALPQAEEITVTFNEVNNDGDNDDDGNNNREEQQTTVHRPKQDSLDDDSDDKSSNDVCALMTMPVTSPNAQLFQGELAASLAIFAQQQQQSTEDDDDDDDDDDHDDDHIIENWSVSSKNDNHDNVS